MLFLPPKNPAKEKWNGLRMSPSDPGIQARTGFASVLPFPEMRATLEKLAKLYPTIYTILPYEKENGGYPHEKEVVDWIHTTVPQTKLRDIRLNIEDLRQIKSPGEIAFLTQAIELSVDAQLAAMRMMRPGLHEYEIAAKMVEVHAMGGSEAEGYAPIVGAGPNSTALHYDKLARKIEDGDIVVLDVGAQYAGYSADITRTLPANGKFTPRQREIYEIVLGAQNAALAAIKPGMDYCQRGSKSVHKIAYDYINSHGKDLHGKSLGQYFIHGLGHDIGLDVHDPGDYCKPLQPGMVVTVEPGIYIPEENLGVRIEDDILITETGYKFLSERLPRNPDEIEKIMAEAAAQRAKEPKERTIDRRERAPLYCLFALGATFRPACLESFRVHRIAERAACRNFRNLQSFRELMSSVKATQLRPGMVVQHEGQLFTVFSVDHRTPGNKRGSMQTRMKNLRTGIMIDYRFRAEEFVDRAILDEVEFEYLYNEGDEFHFMNTQTYEQMQMTREELGETVYYLIPNTTVKIEFYEEKPIGVDLAGHDGTKSSRDRADAAKSHG